MAGSSSRLPLRPPLSGDHCTWPVVHRRSGSFAFALRRRGQRRLVWMSHGTRIEDHTPGAQVCAKACGCFSCCPSPLKSAVLRWTGARQRTEAPRAPGWRSVSLGSCAFGERPMEQRSSALHRDSGVWARSRDVAPVLRRSAFLGWREMDPHAVNLLQQRIRLIIALLTR